MVHCKFSGSQHFKLCPEKKKIGRRKDRILGWKSNKKIELTITTNKVILFSIKSNTSKNLFISHPKYI